MPNTRAFQIGDRVVATRATWHRIRGLVGTVMAISTSGDLDVMFGALSTGHDGDSCDGTRKHWYVMPHELDLVTDVLRKM